MQEQVKNQKHADGTPAKKMEAHEAANANQARGMDTQAMIPVLAMIAELFTITLFRWVSVPDLKIHAVLHRWKNMEAGGRRRRPGLELPDAGEHDKSR